MSRPEGYAEGIPGNLLSIKELFIYLRYWLPQMLMDPMGGIVMTNDGNAILREVSFKLILSMSTIFMCIMTLPNALTLCHLFIYFFCRSKFNIQLQNLWLKSAALRMKKSEMVQHRSSYSVCYRTNIGHRTRYITVLTRHRTLHSIWNK